MERLFEEINIYLSQEREKSSTNRVYRSIERWCNRGLVFSSLLLVGAISASFIPDANQKIYCALKQIDYYKSSETKSRVNCTDPEMPQKAGVECTWISSRNKVCFSINPSLRSVQ